MTIRCVFAGLLLAASAPAQYAPSATPATVPAAEINSKPAFQVVAGAPTSLACTRGKDLAFNSVGLTWHLCTVTGSPGTWVQVETAMTFSTGLSRSGSAVTCLAANGSTLGCLSAADWMTFNAKVTNPLTTAGDIFIGGASGAPSRLAAGDLDTVLQGGGTATAPSYVSLTNCGDASHAMAYSTSTHLWSCQAISTITGNAGTATALQSAPTKCSAGQYPIGIDASGNSQSCAALQTAISGAPGTWPSFGTFALLNNPLTTAGDVYVGGASGAPSRLAAGLLDTILQGGGTATAPSYVSLTNCGDASHAMGYSTSTHTWSCQAISTISGNAATATAFATAPTKCSAGQYPIGIDASGNSQSCAALASSTAATTVNGQTCTLGSSCTIPLSAVNAQTATYQALAADFSNYKTITVASGTFTITLVASGSQPAAGQYLTLLNYGSGVVTVARSGQNLNGGTTSLTLPAASATAPSSMRVVSDGTDYFVSLQQVPPTTTCSNQFVRAVNGTAAATCASVANADLPSTAKTRSIGFSLGDPGGSALTVGGANSVDYRTVTFACTISAINFAIDAADSTFRVKFWKVATGTAIPTSGNSISTSGTGVPTGTAIHNTTVSDFTTLAVAANDIIAMALSTANTVKYVSGDLQCDQ